MFNALPKFPLRIEHIEHFPVGVLPKGVLPKIVPRVFAVFLTNFRRISDAFGTFLFSQ